MNQKGASKYFLPYLDSARGLAAMLVVLHHFFLYYPFFQLTESIPVAWVHSFFDGRAPVRFFFVLSGFVLASLTEGFGRVFLEALSAGLNVFTHDYPVSRQVLGEYAFYGDFSKKRELATLLQMFPDDDMAKKIERVEYVKRSYSWDVLKSKYVDMLKKL